MTKKMLTFLLIILVLTPLLFPFSIHFSSNDKWVVRISINVNIITINSNFLEKVRLIFSDLILYDENAPLKKFEKDGVLIFSPIITL